MEHCSKYTTTVLEYAHSVAQEYSFGDMIAAREMPAEYEEMQHQDLCLRGSWP